MKTINKRRVATGLLAVLALLAAACGGDAGESEQADGPTAAELEATSAEEPAGTQDAAVTEAEEGESCYEGETATFVVSFGAGGGYDQIARTIAPHLEDALGATVVVENRTGAGGLLAANSVFTAEPDGLTFGFFSGQGIAGSVLGGAEGVQFDLLDFSYVARLGADSRLLAVGANSGYETIEDVRGSQGLRFASTGPGGSDHIDATVLMPILDIDGEIITGYEGTSDTELSVTSGDTDALPGTVESRLPAIENGDHRAVVIIGEERVDELPGIPTLFELDLSEDKLALAEAHTALQEMGRMVWAPPGVPEQCLGELRDAFEAAMDNAEFLEQMEAVGRPVSYLSADEARAVAESVLNAPEEYRALLEQSFQAQ
ncbi:MAG TPA: tripartite tricarboxylate transporter substrate binding protein [Nocardioidaceae bacterium]|nr:tripartite tricarboxylate transporter substrate binding protein [Nocardioidaceae bacterium]